MAFGHHHRAGAKCGGGPQDGTDIVRVGHLIQRDDHRRRDFRQLVAQILDPQLRQRGGVDHHALVDGAGRQHALQLRPVDDRRLGPLQPLGARRGEGGLQSGAAGFGRQKPVNAPLGVGPGCGNRMQAVQKNSACRRRTVALRPAAAGARALVRLILPRRGCPRVARGVDGMLVGRAAGAGMF